MGGGRRKEYYEKMGLEQEALSVRGWILRAGVREKGLCTAVLGRFPGWIGGVEARSRKPRQVPLLVQE